MKQDIATTIDTFVTSVSALNKYNKTAQTKLSKLRNSRKDNALAVFEAGGTWKDCVNALEETEESFSQQTLEKYFIKWKEQKAIENGEKVEKKNAGGRKNPDIEAGEKQATESMTLGYPTTLEESVNYGVLFGKPAIEASIKKMHNDGNPCFVPESASDLDKQLAIVNTQEAVRRANGQARDGIARAQRDSANIAKKLRETEKIEA